MDKSHSQEDELVRQTDSGLVLQFSTARIFLAEEEEEEEEEEARVVVSLSDITDKKRAELALKESEERFRFLAESSLTGIYLIQDQKFAYVNQSLAATFGYTVEEIVGKLGPLDLTHPDDRPRVVENIRRRVAGEVEAIRYDFQGVKKDGTVIHLEVHGRRIEYAGKIGIIGTLVDITQRKREESLRLRLSQVLESIAGDEALPQILERLVRAIEEYQPDMKGSVLLLDAAGKRLHHGAAPNLPEDYNTAIDGLLIGPRVGSCGTAAYEKRLVIVEDIQTDPLWADFRELAAKHALRACWSQPIIDHEGAVLGTFALYYTQPRKPAEAELRLINTAADIAGIAIKRRRAEEALRENEQRYRSIVENINQAYYEADRRAMFTYCNPGALIISGYTAEELLGTVSYRLIADEDRRKVIAQYEQWYKEKRTDVVMEFRVQTKSGRIFWVEQVTHFEFNAQGDFVKATNVLRDIDERKRAEEELQRSHEWLNSIFEASRDGIIVEENEQIVYVNRAAVQLYGYSDPQELIGKHVSLLQSEEDNERMLEYGRKRERGELVPTVYEFKGRRKDGSLFDCEISVSQGTIGGRTLIIAVLRDITERKRAQKQIDMLAHAVRSIGECVSITDMEDKLLFVNEAFLKTYGYEENDLLGKHIGIVRSPKNAPEVVSEILPETLRDTWQGELLNRRKDGSEFPIFLSTSVVHDDKGQPVALVGVATDITERKRAEEELRKSEERYRLVLQNSLDAIYLYEAGTQRLLEANRTFLNLLGYSADEIPTLTIYDIIAHDTASIDRYLEQVLTTGGVIIGDRKWKRKDGTLVDVDVSVNKIRQNEKDIVFVSARDISHRKRAEEALEQSERKYRMLTENLKDVVYRADPLTLYATFVNSAIENLYGYTTDEWLNDPTLWEKTLHPEDKETVMRHLRDAVALGKDSEVECRILRKDGTERWVIDRFSWERDASGQITALNGVITDITERKRVQEEKKQLETQLIQAQKLESLGTLASGIAHDFNNILGIILGHASLVERIRSSPEQLAKSVEAISTAAQRGASLVKQMLTFARKTESVLEPIELNTLVKGFVSMLRETFPKTIELRKALFAGLPPVVADSTQLHQVLLNLCVNARDAMPRGGTLTLTTELFSAEAVNRRFPAVTPQEYIALGVTDTGIGMDERTRERIFEPFFTTKGPGQGTGLGLAVVHGIVASHGGFIDVKSAPGKGTTFCVYLPVARKTVTDFQSAPAPTAETPGGSETILIVEDEQQLRELLKMLLSSKGYNIIVAEDGEEAVRLYRRHQQEIALVMSDMGLPKLAGDEVFRQIRRIDPKAKVMLASGFVEPSAKSELLKAGVRDFVQKPYAASDLLRKVRGVIDAQDS